jgi:hypothetical protein
MHEPHGIIENYEACSYTQTARLFHKAQKLMGYIDGKIQRDARAAR